MAAPVQHDRIAQQPHVFRTTGVGVPRESTALADRLIEDIRGNGRHTRFMTVPRQ